jgi:hypothetical protein
VYRNGGAVASLESGEIQWRDELDDVTRVEVLALFTRPRDENVGRKRISA